MYHKKPQPLKKLISDFLEHSPYRDSFLRGRVLALWAEVVGEQVARQCRHLHFDRGRLIVHVHNPAWRQELHMQRYSIMKRLNEEVRSPVIKEIVVRS